MNSIIKLAFDILIALLLLGTSIFMFIHYRRGEDVSSLTFATASLALFAVLVVEISIVSITGALFVPSQHTLRYLSWYIAFGYLLYAVGVFWSIFFSNKRLSVYMIPVIVFISVLLGFGFINEFTSWLPKFGESGLYVLILTWVVLLTVSISYFLHWVNNKHPFRIYMSIAFLLLTVSLILHTVLPVSSFFWYVNHIIRLAGFSIIFFQIQTGSA